MKRYPRQTLQSKFYTHFFINKLLIKQKMESSILLGYRFPDNLIH